MANIASIVESNCPPIHRANGMGVDPYDGPDITTDYDSALIESVNVAGLAEGVRVWSFGPHHIGARGLVAINRVEYRFDIHLHSVDRLAEIVTEQVASDSAFKRDDYVESEVCRRVHVVAGNWATDGHYGVHPLSRAGTVGDYGSDSAREKFRAMLPALAAFADGPIGQELRHRCDIAHRIRIAEDATKAANEIQARVDQLRDIADRAERGLYVSRDEESAARYTRIA